MSDALDVLFDAGGSTEPDPRFRSELMARVRGALDAPTVAGGELPAHVVEAEPHADVRSYVEVAPRSPAPPYRSRRWMRPLLIAAASIAVLVLLMSLVRGGADDRQQPSPLVTDPPATSAAPRVVATTVEDWVCPNPERNYVNFCRGPLDPGAHETWAFDPSFAFVVPDGWSNLEDKTGNYLLLPPGTDWDGYKARTGDYLGLYTSIAAPAGCKEYPEPSVPTTVEAYVDWLRQQPSLLVSEPVPVAVGGLAGTQVDVSLSAGSVCSDPEIGEAYAPLFIGTNASIVTERVHPGERIRLNLFDRPDGTLMVVDVADVGGSESAPDWLTVAGRITDSFQFEA
jgi:hypothetical protein